MENSMARKLREASRCDNYYVSKISNYCKCARVIAQRNVHCSDNCTKCSEECSIDYRSGTPLMPCTKRTSSTEYACCEWRPTAS